MPYLDSFFGILDLDCSQVLDLRRLLECTRRLEAVFVLVLGELFTIDYDAIDMVRQKCIECIVELLRGSRLEESSDMALCPKGERWEYGTRRHCVEES